MLDPDEHRALVRRYEYSCDLADIRSDKEPACFTRCRVGAEHLVVAEADVGTAVDGAARYVGLNPEPAARRYVDAIRRTVLVAEDRRAVRRVGGGKTLVSRLIADHSVVVAAHVPSC